jgi:carbonic anhydrase
MRVLPLFILSLFTAVAFADEECPPRYSYCGYSGPAQWPNLPIAKNECGGAKQSPINLRKLAVKPGPVINVKYTAEDATIENSGHDIRVIPTTKDPGGITIGKEFYRLDNFHFHTPSEHNIRGFAAPAEMHVVHKSVKGNYAVIGVMVTTGRVQDKALMPVFANLPLKVCAKVAAKIAFDTLLPKELPIYYTYIGSLTTPPCTEGVNWYVLDEPLEILEEDLPKLGELGPNARPIQKNPKQLDVTYIIPN